MPDPIPAPVATYFAGNARFDVDAMLASFAPDAVVADERRTHVGLEAIRAWIVSATVDNRAVATPRQIGRDADDVTAVAEVTGDFAGSPVTLTFRFTLADGLIVRLDIR